MELSDSFARLESAVNEYANAKERRIAALEAELAEVRGRLARLVEAMEAVQIAARMIHEEELAQIAVEALAAARGTP